MALPTHGTMAVDWEQRIDFDRLRTERLQRVKDLLAKSEMGAILCFDMNNVRYITSTHIGSWAQDKMSRFTLLTRKSEPILWDFGSAAKHHQLHCPWLGERSRAGIPLLRGAMSPEMGRAEDVAKKIRIELEEHGLLHEPLGVDIIEPPILFALQREGITVGDADLQKRIAELAAARNENPKQLRAELEKNRRLPQIEAQIREQKTLDMLISQAKITDEDVLSEPASSLIVTPEEARREAQEAQAGKPTGAAANVKKKRKDPTP